MFSFLTLLFSFHEFVLFLEIVTASFAEAPLLILRIYLCVFFKSQKLSLGNQFDREANAWSNYVPWQTLFDKQPFFSVSLLHLARVFLCPLMPLLGHFSYFVPLCLDGIAPVDEPTIYMKNMMSKQVHSCSPIFFLKMIIIWEKAKEKKFKQYFSEVVDKRKKYCQQNLSIFLWFFYFVFVCSCQIKSQIRK